MSSAAVPPLPGGLIVGANEASRAIDALSFDLLTFIHQLVEGAKQGSMEHIHGLGIRMAQLYEGYSEGILDALLPHLKYPEDGPPKECGPTYMAMSALTQVNAWHTAYGGQCGLASSFSRIVPASDACILWAKELLETLGSTQRFGENRRCRRTPSSRGSSIARLKRRRRSSRPLRSENTL
ncbi:hypothetical protein FA13DRAFT_1737804 [Coprinellus micaceus]|uniref:Uncharacterized protein n=1 Tax=Coprinellus micaceus TaxID=71717 RepID=A0A4Y7SWB0_COPMI|nr:hypothetical protein FA13DRAFT_1737804 [Coprinellus micaceus]